jgi:ABC-2 type transport system permease protein
MKRFWGFVIKEFYHIFRDFRTVIVLFGIPIAQIFIFGYVISNEIRDVKIAILDQSKDIETRKITNKLLSSGYFILSHYLNTHDEIKPAFEEGKIKEIIIFEPGFAEKIGKEGKATIQLLADASDANTANLVVNYTSGIIWDYVQETNRLTKLSFQINTETRMMFNQSLKGSYMFIPGIIALIMMLISAMMTSISITREKELGTMEVLLVTPLKPLQIILGKVTPYIGLSFINAVIIIIVGYFVFDVPVVGSLILLMAFNILYILLALSVGILISTVSNSQQMAMFLSAFALMLPTILLSGFIFPIENMPSILQWLSAIMPPRWFISGIRDIMLKGTGLVFIWHEVLILTGMTMFFMMLSVRKFKIRLE